MATRSSAQDLLAVALASGAMAKLVRYFAVNPDSAPHVRALQRVTGLRPSSLKNELDRLLTLGLLVRQQDGNRVRFRVDEESPLWAQFRTLVRQLSTPADVLPYAFGEVEGIEGAFIFGSFAKGSARDDSDVDVLVLGDDVDEPSLSRHTLEASVLLGREVNVVQATPHEFRSTGPSGRFYQRVAREAKQWLVDRSGLARELEAA
ncbi:MAG TPA: nucleotidyltransferase domain-containing protein [Longimicrobium sp.]|jgi:predicted nucleotidyltransferase